MARFLKGIRVKRAKRGIVVSIPRGTLDFGRDVTKKEAGTAFAQGFRESAIENRRLPKGSRLPIKVVERRRRRR